MLRLSAKRSLLLSVLFHASVLLMLVALAWYGWLDWTVTDSRSSTDAQDQQPNALRASSSQSPAMQRVNDLANIVGDPSQQADLQPEQVQYLFSTEFARAQRTDPDQQLEQIEQLQSQLSGIAVDRVTGVAAIVEQSFGVDETTRQRAYEPDPDAQGRFDANTAILYDIESFTDQRDQSVHYRLIYLDDQGRVLKNVRSAEQLTDSELRMARIYEMARENPQLRSLLDSINRMYVAREMQSQDKPEQSDKTLP